MTKKEYVLLVVIVPLMLIDQHLSQIYQSLFLNKVEISSLLFLITFFRLTYRLDFIITLALSIFLGMIYDYYYLDFLGVYFISLPIATVALYILNNILNISYTSFQRLIVFSIFIFTILMINNQLLNMFYQSNVTWYFFITYKLLPTLLLNGFYFVIFNKQKL